MKKQFLFLTFLPLLVAACLFSCQKTDDLAKQATPIVKSGPVPGNEGSDEVTTRSGDDPFDYAQCPLLLGAVIKTDGRLVFESEEHFEKCALCLEHQYDNHNDAFDAQYPNATAEQLDAYAASTGFNEWQPYTNFETSLSFSSYRAKIKTESETFLASTLAELIDLNQDPDLLSPVFRTAERVFLNEGGEVKVGSDIKTIEDDWAKSFDDCAGFLLNGYTYTEANNPVLVDRRVAMSIAVDAGIVVSILWGKIKYYKRDPVTGNYRSNVRADMKVSVSGYGYNNNCDLTSSTWAKDSGWKKRTQRQVTARIWTNIRLAFIDRNDPAWMTNRCIAHGYLFNGNNYFPIAL